jgi:hypothetical protein
MFALILISGISAAHLYLFWRTSSVPFFRHHVPKKLLNTAGLLLWGVFLAGILYGRRHTGPLADWLEMAGLTWMGVLFLLTVALLAVEIISGFGFLLPCLAPPMRGFVLFVGTILAAVALAQGLRSPVVSDYEVKLAGLPPELDGKVLVALSDLHLGSQLGEEWLAARLAQVNALNPDLIVLTGDVLEGHGRPRLKLLTTLRGLKAPLGVWGVVGNHEFYGGPETIKALEESGIGLLRDAWIQVRPGLVLAGVEEHTFSRRPQDGAGRIARALAGHPAGAVILLSHKPWREEEAARAGVDLMLSGHTHGGQIWPFNYLVGHFFPHLAGRYEIKGMTLLVGRGTGTWGPRMRLWQPGEILKITLGAKSPAPEPQGK